MLQGHTYIVPFRHLPQVRQDLEAGDRIQSAIQDNNFRTVDELTGNAYSTFLTSGQSFSKRPTDGRLCSIVQAKRGQRAIHQTVSLGRSNIAW